MKKFIVYILGIITALSLAYAGLEVINDLVVDGNVFFTNLPYDGDGNGLVMSGTQLHESEICGTFGFLEDAITITTGAGTRYPIAGTFTNLEATCFVASGAGGVYYGTPKTYVINEIVTVMSDTVQTEANIGIAVNGTLLSGSDFQRYLENTSDIGSWTTMGVAKLYSGDLVQLIVKSNKAGAELTITSTARLQKFY